MKKHLLLLLLLLLFLKANAQQSSIFIQSADDFGSDNPAGLSIEEMRYPGMSASVLARNQWWKFNAAGYPQTQRVSWLDNTSSRYQVGAAFLADKIGETRQAGISGRYAHIIIEGLKIGVSAGIISQTISFGNLDIYDTDDPVADAASGARWRLLAGAGAFYSGFDPLLSFRWYAGLSFQYASFLQQLPGMSETPSEAELLAQGGVRWGTWWSGGRLRISLEQPSALDFYLRKYLLGEEGIENNFFLGGILTADRQYQVAGLQAGYERKLRSGGFWDNHYLVVILGFSKPLSKYIYGGNLIFDAKAAWAWQRKPSR